MPSRPSLTQRSFLAAVFSPKKNPVPTGLRKRKLVGKKWKASRLRAYNNMSAINQEILSRSGQRDAYLNGTASLADAKRSLRSSAVDMGLVKPLRQRRPQTSRFTTPTNDALRRMLAAHVKRTLSGNVTRLNPRTIDDSVQYIEPVEDMLTWTAPQIKYAARQGSEYEVVESDGTRHNAFWYH